jgi:hypothetical protein
MNKHMHVFAVFVCAFVGTASAQVGAPTKPQVRTPTQVIEQGMLALVKSDEAAAVDIWINKGTSIPPKQREALVASFTHAKGLFGSAEDFEIVRDGPLSQRVRVLYAIVHYRSAPLFFRFYMYRLAGGEWASIKIKADTDAPDVFPPEFAYGRVPGG